MGVLFLTKGFASSDFSAFDSSHMYICAGSHQLGQMKRSRGNWPSKICRRLWEVMYRRSASRSTYLKPTVVHIAAIAKSHPPFPRMTFNPLARECLHYRCRNAQNDPQGCWRAKLRIHDEPLHVRTTFAHFLAIRPTSSCRTTWWLG